MLLRGLVLRDPIDDWASQTYAKLYPGGHACVFGNARTALEAENVGFEVRDCLTVLGPTVHRVWLFRRPIEITVAAQMLSTGTGGIWVDGCRISTSTEDAKAMDRAVNSPGSGQLKAHASGFHGKWSGSSLFDATKGRWPANLVLMHGEGCQRDGLRRVRSSGGHYDKTKIAQTTFAQDVYTRTKMRQSTVDHADIDGLETVAIWQCVSGCSVAYIDAQSGKSVSKVGNPRASAEPGQGWGMTTTGSEYNDSGGASRFFPQFSSELELDAWLTRLILGSV